MAVDDIIEMANWDYDATFAKARCNVALYKILAHLADEVSTSVGRKSKTYITPLNNTRRVLYLILKAVEEGI